MSRVKCDVLFPKGVSRLGNYANAFRIIPDTGDEVLLDFCQFTASGNEAKVVARIRIQASFISLIVQRMMEEGNPTAFFEVAGAIEGEH